MMRYLPIGLFSVFTAAVFACGSDGSSSPSPPDDSDAAPPAYTGPAKSGVLVNQDGATDFQPDPADGDGSVPPLPCCKITFALPDATNNETTAILRGDVAPLDADAGIPLTWAGGKWSATACVTEQTYLRYRFYFGQIPEIPGGSTTIDDNRTDPSQPVVGDGAGGEYNTFGPVAACSDVDAAVGP